jgi:hypothetical protein
MGGLVGLPGKKSEFTEIGTSKQGRWNKYKHPHH